MKFSELKTAIKALLIAALVSASVIAQAAPTMEQAAVAARQADAAAKKAQLCAGAINTTSDVEAAFKLCDETTLNKLYVSLDAFKNEAAALNAELDKLKSKNKGEVDRIETLKFRAQFPWMIALGAFGGIMMNIPGAPDGVSSGSRVSAFGIVLAATIAYMLRSEKVYNNLVLSVNYRDIAAIEDKLNQIDQEIYKKKNVIAWMLQLKQHPAQ